MKNKIDSFFRPNNEQNDKENKDKKPSKKIGYLIILGLTGLLLLFISNMFSSSEEPEISQEPPSDQSEPTGGEEEMAGTDISELEQELSGQLATMLNKIQGVNDAEVMVNLDATSEQIYEKNQTRGQQTTDETDQNGGSRVVEDQTEESQVVLFRSGDQEIPLLVQTKQPEVRGVFVVAKGAETPSLKNQVIEAVSRVLDVPTHKISVMPKN
ncbi:MULTISPECIES: stage III sporulation protein AG [Oceanobacillus]|uniref:Stage III sporulation protein AG n=1 Tax=Oceanobacillus kimchii TaxID=746691 RepID=A0ABQ5TK40_9BACI|nr:MULTISPECIES: stage III sporulation protein AG [Oceanobacillus]MBT2598360.1 stage III sporulation protein AG [Oceanobacillus sp. ISL-74]MBT2651278.1 stage III sporulation protein AG [Oceanobacillus sp. ISL-73]MCT1575937.1 stage III sporulation protein AG [Oceanobacillus kimchii]MCT2135574.1 stage III sporulation protein AG [Oceanobacillus kimchii]OEH55677.1 stage III sporulation protein AG [Oceanobacillus sp. E9]